MSEKMTQIVIRLPADIKRNFKSLCVSNGESMEGTGIKLIKEFIRKEYIKRGEADYKQK